MKPREFWIDKLSQDETEFKCYEDINLKGDQEFLHVREVLPGEDDMIKELVDAIKHLSMCHDDDGEFAESILAKYKAFREGK